MKTGNKGAGIVKRTWKSLQPCKCDFEGCGKTFSKRSNLKAHMRVHDGALPFPCFFPGCTKRFRWKSSLKPHVKMHLSCGDRFPFPTSIEEQEGVNSRFELNPCVSINPLEESGSKKMAKFDIDVKNVESVGQGQDSFFPEAEKTPDFFRDSLQEKQGKSHLKESDQRSSPSIKVIRPSLENNPFSENGYHLSYNENIRDTPLRQLDLDMEDLWKIQGGLIDPLEHSIGSV